MKTDHTLLARVSCVGSLPNLIGANSLPPTRILDSRVVDLESGTVTGSRIQRPAIKSQLAHETAPAEPAKEHISSAEELAKMRHWESRRHQSRGGAATFFRSRIKARRRPRRQRRILLPAQMPDRLLEEPGTISPPVSLRFRWIYCLQMGADAKQRKTEKISLPVSETPGNHAVRMPDPQISRLLLLPRLVALVFGILSAIIPASAVTYEQWKTEHFTAQQLADPATSGDMADPDSDGRPNLLEYAFGRDPSTSDASPHFPEVFPLSLTYPERIDATDLLYHYNESSDLLHWITVNSPARSVLGTENNLRTVQVFDPAAPGVPTKWFARLRVRLGEAESLFAPTNLAAAIEEPFAVVLGWNDNAAIEEGYQVERDTGDGFVPLAEVGTDTNLFRDEAVVGSATYTYRVSAFQGEQLSDPSNEVTVTLPLDSDGDGLSDEAELNRFGTDPFNSDSDGDGLPDGWEVRYGLNPGVMGDETGDMDADSLDNYWEYALGFDPTLQDSDGNGVSDNDEDSDRDGMPDGWEITNGLDPKIDDAGSDPDGDGLSNAEEWETGTKANAVDSDTDGKPDGEDAVGYDPLFKHPRLPALSGYALIDLGEGVATKINNSNKVLIVSDSASRLWSAGGGNM